MDREMIICVPGPWVDRSDFIGRIVMTEPKARYMFVATMLADLQTQEQISVDFCGADPRMKKAFETAGQGTISDECLEQIGQHRSVVYLHFPLDLVGERERVSKFTHLMRELGGFAIKVESAGVAHMWGTWERRLNGSAFDLYCSAIVLVGDKQSFYSCGMHHFGLPECEVPSYIGSENGAALINRFNAWQIGDRPAVKSGETFSMAADELPFRLDLYPDRRYAEDDLFHNPHGVWVLTRATSSEPLPNKWKKPEGEPLFMMIHKDDEQMLKAYAAAKKTLPIFLDQISSSRFCHAVHSVKIKLRDEELSEKLGEDRFSYLWLWEVQQVDADILQAVVRELPKDGISGLKIGETLQFSHDDVHDWMIVDGSQAWGGFTLRAVRDRMGPQERLQYAEYTGILCFNEL